jgi:hypothetical protein
VTSAEDVLDAVMRREVACIDRFPSFPRDRPQGIFNGPGVHQPSKEFKLAVIEHYSRILPHIIPKYDASVASILWHNNLHSDNIFVNENCLTETTGIIGSSFDDGEAYVQSLPPQLAEQETWRTVIKASNQGVSDVPCPIIYSDEELLQQKDDLSK